MPAPIHRPGPLALTAALEVKRDFLLGMPVEDVRTGLELDPSNAAGVVTGALPRILSLRDEIGVRFGAEGLALVDDLQTVAYACQQADIELANADEGIDLVAMRGEVVESHALLITEADSLANRKLLERSRIGPSRSVQGYRTAVTSTLTLVDLYRKIWPQIAGKTFLTTADLDRIEQSCQAMLDAVNVREHGTHRLPAVDLRNGALSHLVSVYDEVRRMTSYVRWRHDDADEIAPSLYAMRRGRTRNTPEPGAPVVTPAPSTPIGTAPPIDPVPGSGGAPFTS